MEPETKLNYTPYPLPSPTISNSYVGLTIFAIAVSIIAISIWGVVGIKGDSTVGKYITPEPTLSLIDPQQHMQQAYPQVQSAYTTMSPSPSVTPKTSPSPTPIPSPSTAPTSTPTNTPVPTSTPTNTPTPTPLPSSTPTPIPTITESPTITPTPTYTPTPTLTPTPTPTSTP